MKPGGRTARTVWALTLLLCLIGAAAVTRRVVQIVAPSPGLGGPAAALDAGFSRHAALTMSHIIPGLLFVILGPLQFLPTLRARRPVLHRWIGRVFLVSGLMIGCTALIMSPRMAIGGVNESAATMLFGVMFLFSLAKAYAAIRKRKVALHREWMIRAFAIGLAVAFIRPIVGIFFATSRLTHLTPHDFFGTAFWLGFSIQTLAAEVWINSTRVRQAAM